MPEFGEIKIDKSRNKSIWAACEGCGKGRWVQFVRNKPRSPLCRSCVRAGNRSSSWKGGRYKDEHGYIKIRLPKDDFFYSMVTKTGYVYEHRLVVAKALGRCLHRWEIVHHKKGFAKDDNRYPKTLQFVTDDRHKQITILENRISQLEKRITLLEAENALLRGTNAADSILEREE